MTKRHTFYPFLGIVIVILLLPLSSSHATDVAQQNFGRRQAWFVDGYHGGIWGHYPKQWYTKFICDNLDANPDWNICLEIEPETWDTIAVLAPDDLARLREYVKAGRVEFTNPSWAQPYMWNIDGECILRQMEAGMQTILRHFPEAQFVTYAVEEPCFTSSLPAILTNLGFRHAVLRCPDTCWGGYPASHGGELVNMIGPDGTSLLCVPRPDCETLEPGSTWQTSSWKNSRQYLQNCRKAGIEHPVGMCYQDAGWKNGPWMGNRATYTTWTNYIEKITSGVTDDDWHFSQEDIHPCLMWGSDVMNHLAQQVRRAENELLQREKLSLLPGAPDDPLTADSASLDNAWKRLFLAQHHDTWIVPYNNLRGKRTWADWVEEWTSLPSLITTSDNSRGSTLRVFNTLGHSRKEVLKVGSKHYKVEVPAFGYRDYTARELKKADKSEICRVLHNDKQQITVTNGVCTVTFDLKRGGVITKMLYNEASTAESFDFAQAMRLDNETEVNMGELRGFFYDKRHWYSSAENKVKCSVEGNGDYCMVITLKGSIAGSPLTQTYTFCAGDPLIDCRLKVDWKGHPSIGEYKQTGKLWKQPRRAWCDDRYKLNILFPTGLHSARLWKDAPFDVCESRQDSTWYNSWDDIHHNIILHWVDISEGVNGYGLALLTDHTGSYGYGKDYPLALTAQYSGVGLWGRNYRIERPLEMHYALMPHHGLWDKAGVDRRSREWNEPLLSEWTNDTKGSSFSLIDLGNTGLEVSGIRRTAEGFEVRLYNTSGNNGAQRIRLADSHMAVDIPRHGLVSININN